MRIPKNSQIRRICISGALFLFYAPRFFKCEEIVLNCFEFFDFRLHLFCQCKLVRVVGLEPTRYAAQEPKGHVTSVTEFR